MEFQNEPTQDIPQEYADDFELSGNFSFKLKRNFSVFPFDYLDKFELQALSIRDYQR